MPAWLNGGWRRYGNQLSWPKVFGIGIPLALVAFVGAASLTRAQQFKGRVLPGVSLPGKDLAGVDASALDEIIEKRAQEREKIVLQLEVADRQVERTLAELGLKVDRAKSKERILKQGRQGSWWLPGHDFGITELHLSLGFNREQLESELSVISKRWLKGPIEGRLWIEKQRLRSEAPELGQMIDTDKALAALEECLDKAEPCRLPIDKRKPAVSIERFNEKLKIAEQMISADIAVKVLPPEDPALSEGLNMPAEGIVFHVSKHGLRLAFRSNLNEKGDDIELGFDPEKLLAVTVKARIDFERPTREPRGYIAAAKEVKFLPAVRGAEMDRAEFFSKVDEASRQKDRTAILRIVPGPIPKMKIEEAEALGIVEQLSVFATHHPCCQNRVKNIHTIADMLNGVVIRPGEKFSVNDFIGPRTKEKGFLDAPTIVQGEMEDTIGGGVSQFATTLFNAVFDAGLELIERQPHSYYFDRYPEGIEATLTFPKPDLVFRNDMDHGVMILCEYTGTTIRVRIYGKSDGRTVTRKVSRRFLVVDPKTEYEADDDMDPTKEKLVQRGNPSWAVKIERWVRYKDKPEKYETRDVSYLSRPKIYRTHSCNIPKKFPGYTGKECPVPEVEEEGVDDDSVSTDGDNTAE